MDPWASQRWAYSKKVGNPARKALLLQLAVLADPLTGRCEAKQSSLTEWLEISIRSVRNHLKGLEDMGLIARRAQRRIDGGRRGDEFLVLAPWVTEWPDGEQIVKPVQGTPPRNDIPVPPRHHLPGGPAPVADPPPAPVAGQELPPPSEQPLQDFFSLREKNGISAKSPVSSANSDLNGANGSALSDDSSPSQQTVLGIPEQAVEKAVGVVIGKIEEHTGTRPYRTKQGVAAVRRILARFPAGQASEPVMAALEFAYANTYWATKITNLGEFERNFTRLWAGARAQNGKKEPEPGFTRFTDDQGKEWCL